MEEQTTQAPVDQPKTDSEPQPAEHVSLEAQLMLASAAGDIDEVNRLLELEADVDYADEEGVTPLMKAAEQGHTSVLATLLQHGAVWNAQDKHGYCAGEYAMGGGHQDAVDLLIDFAVQAELVLGALHRRMQVGSPASSSCAPNSDYLQQRLVYKGEQLLDADGEAVMMGWERPLMLRHAEVICPNARRAKFAAQDKAPAAADGQASTSAATATTSSDAQQPPSESAAAAVAGEASAQGQASGSGAGAGAGTGAGAGDAPVLPRSGSRQRSSSGTGGLGRSSCGGYGGPEDGGHVLNVGFGLGIVDSAIQSHRPARHTIVEAHPDVVDHMTRTGWAARPGVRVLRGRWQDVLPELLAEAPYDGIFFDTYGEYYEEMREFHAHLPRLLAPDGVYSFFNGLASDNIFFHMVYCRLISLELAAKGLEVEYEPLSVEALGDDVWQGVRSKYWHFETYFLPVVRHGEALVPVPEGEEAEGPGSGDLSGGKQRLADGSDKV